MDKKLLFTAALAAITNNVLAADMEEIPECLDGTDVNLKDIGTVEWPVSWAIEIEPSKKCYYVTYSTSYIRWE